MANRLSSVMFLIVSVLLRRAAEKAKNGRGKNRIRQKLQLRQIKRSETNSKTE